ncbi:MAG TPA: PGPGW domain-containing protein [Acidimicrobiia bacterium]|nr:PGPGW domain-containing protein [Acidimicrobiia bacterium]
MTRIARVLGGFILIIAGLAMLVLPGPGILTILGGLALIGQEFEWARRIVDRVKAMVANVLRQSSEQSTEDRSDHAGHPGG